MVETGGDGRGDWPEPMTAGEEAFVKLFLLLCNHAAKGGLGLVYDHFKLSDPRVSLSQSHATPADVALELRKCAVRVFLHLLNLLVLPRQLQLVRTHKLLLIVEGRLAAQR